MNLEKMHVILKAREERSWMQQNLLADGGVLISFSLNIPGPVKNSALYRLVFEKGERQIDDCLKKNGMKAEKKVLCSDAGDCGFWLLPGKEEGEAAERIKSAAAKVKSLMTDLEEKGRLGRLMDMDVLYLAPGMQEPEKVSRTELGKGRRTCLVCGQPVFHCIRSARHQVPEVLMEAVDRILEDREMQSRILGWDKQNAVIADKVRPNHMKQSKTDRADGVCPEGKNGFDANPEAEETGKMLVLEAFRALLYEVIITPKPGLVDAENSGAHEDMDVTTFFDSALAIVPYLLQCFETGRQNAVLSPDKMLPLLRPYGIEAERKMYEVTSGVNTHKGAVFTFGILLAACGMMYGKAVKSEEAVKAEQTEKTEKAENAEKAGKSRRAGTNEKTLTEVSGMPEACYTQNWNAEEILNLAGQICSSMENGSEGFRQEVMHGYPTLRARALPVLRNYRKSVKAETCAEAEAGAETEAETGAEAKTEAKANAEAEAGRLPAENPHVLLNAAAVRALLGLMSELDDANMLRRAGREKLEEVKKRITGILEKNPDDAQLLKAAAELDAWMIQENISPGGSADLLAAALFLASVESGV